MFASPEPALGVSKVEYQSRISNEHTGNKNAGYALIVSDSKHVLERTEPQVGYLLRGNFVRHVKILGRLPVFPNLR